MVPCVRQVPADRQRLRVRSGLCKLDVSERERIHCVPRDRTREQGPGIMMIIIMIKRKKKKKKENKKKDKYR